MSEFRVFTVLARGAGYIMSSFQGHNCRNKTNLYLEIHEVSFYVARTGLNDFLRYLSLKRCEPYMVAPVGIGVKEK